MPESVIAQLFFDIQNTLTLSKGYKNNFERSIEMEKNLQKNLTSEQLELLKDLLALQCDLRSEGEFLQFEIGFKLGLQLGKECFAES